MKKLETIVPFALILLAASVCLVGCKGEPPCPDARETTHSIKAMETFYWPYTGYDTLCFIKNVDDTTYVYGSGRKYFYETEAKRESNPDCNVFYTTHYEAYNLFLSNNSTLIEVTQKQIEPAFEIKYRNCIFKLQSVRLITASNELKIRQKIYDRIAFITNEQGDSLYLNKQYGILKIYEKASNESIELVPKE